MNECANCHRRNITTTTVPWDSLRTRTRKTYYNIQRHVSQEEFCLCHQCREHLLQPPGSTPKCVNYWPAMIWKFLTPSTSVPHASVLQLDIVDKWTFIPSQWRPWWLQDVRRLNQSLSLMAPEPRFYLATDDLAELEDALALLEWKTMGRAIDKFLSFPSVRCPFGCSEFLHKCNKLPLEDFLIFRSNGCFKGYGGTTKRKKNTLWTDGIKPNFPSSAIILENDLELVCRPTIVLDDQFGPCILACSQHRKTSTVRYVHPPESPTGTLYTESSNQYAQAVIQSRTLRKTKLNVYSDTYQTAMLQGGFDGLDTCYLTSAGHYLPTNKLADLRDCLSISGRDDFRNHVAQLSCNVNARNYVPGRNVHDKLRRADFLFPNLEQKVNSHLQSATFVTLEDAIQLQEDVYGDVGQQLRIFPDDDDINTGENYDDILFQPPWPNMLLWIHPYDGYGEPFYSVQNKPLDSFVGWVMLALVMNIPFLWSAVASTLETNKSWKGWLMSIAWHQIRHTTRTRQKNYFPLQKPSSPDDTGSPTVRNQKWLRQKLFIREAEKDTNIGVLRRLWRRVKGVQVMYGQWIANQEGLDQATVVVLLRNSDSSRPPYQPFIRNADWELRMAILKDHGDGTQWKGTIYTRHGGATGPMWWIQPQKDAPCVLKCRDICIADVEATFHVCVFVRTETQSSIHLRNRYLSCLGGQATVYCGIHRLPLILNPTKKTLRTTIGQSDQDNDAPQSLCCCEKNSNLKTLPHKTWSSVATFCRVVGSLACAHTGCTIAICNNHFTSLMTNSDRFNFVLTQGSCATATYDELVNVDMPAPTDNDDGNNDDDDDELSFHQLLPNDSDSIDSSTTLEQESEILPTLTVDAISNLGPCNSYEYAGELLPELEEYDSDESIDENNPEGQNFLSTSAAAEMMDIDFAAPDEIASCPLHVLLNQQGHLLVRKKCKLRMTRRHANFFQRIVATSKGKTLPLVYAESLLFPDTFFFGTQQGAIIGAIPTALWTDQKVLNTLGIASMRCHAKARLSDPATLCSTDSRYHFLMFDCLVNLGMRGNDSRLILHRGFASKQDGDGVALNKSDNSELYSDAIEDHSNVHKLASLIADSPPHYFFTQSCNQSTCRGLAKLRKWITSETAITKVQSKYGVTYEEASHLLRRSAAPYVQRVWDVVADLWMRYIVYSKEEPLHKIEWAWWRKEFQDQAGNVSHIHAILRTTIDVNTIHGCNIVLEKIRGSLADLVHFQELVQMKEDGIVESLDCLSDILKDAISFLTHKCSSRCQVPKTSHDGEVTFVCKVPSNSLLTTQPQIHTIQPVNVRHSPAALATLLRLNLAEEKTSTASRKTIEIIHPLLRMVRHVPKCSSKDNKFSPTNGKLFVMMPSSQNLQYCTGHSLSLYLTSYVTEVDRVSLIFIRPPTAANDNTMRLEYHGLNNTKIRSVNTHHTEKLNNDAKTRHLPRGRAITHMEALTVIFGSPLISSTRQFIYFPTTPREYRAALYVPYLKMTCRPQDLQAIRAITGETARRRLGLPDCRCFTQNQIKVIQDELDAPLSTDALTYFSMRPPELRFVRKQSLYLQWFERKSVTQLFDPAKSLAYVTSHVSLIVMESEWLDGFNYKIVLRRPAISHCLEYARSCDQRHFGPGAESTALKNDILHLLSRLLYLYNTIILRTISRRGSLNTLDEWEILSTRFLSTSYKRQLPVTWFTPISPKRKSAFLIQLLLSMGEFETEYELMLSGNLRRAFIMANLFNPSDPGASLDALLRRYVLEHLRTFPGSHYQFDRNLCLAETCLREELLGTTPSPIDSTPSVLYSHMRQETDEKIERHIQSERERLIDTLHHDLRKCGFSNVLPPRERMKTTRNYPILENEILFFPPPICRRQNNASYDEQKRVLCHAKHTIDCYLDPTRTHKNLSIVGGPGVGKTTVSQIITLYALCRGLNGTATSLVAERSKQLGGTHIHRLFGLHGFDMHASPGHIAERTIRDLYRYPNVLWLLLWMDFMFLDEFGLLNAELMAVMDMIMRYIRRSSAYMGGVLVITTIDIMQLMPFQGIPAMLSTFIITEYQFTELTQSVRASDDPALQEICQLTRTLTWTREKRERLRYLLARHCNFVDDFNSPTIPDHAVFIFGRRDPCNAAENLMLERMKSLHPYNYVIAHAGDEQSTTAGNWTSASTPTSRRLSRIIKQREHLLFYPKARYEFTHNGERDQFLQGQLAICVDVPTLQSIENNEPITVFKGPAGLKEFPPSDLCDTNNLALLGWKAVRVPFSTTRSENVFRGIQARRSQYGLKPRVASTIHGCMGATLSSVVTALVTQPGSSLNFTLWESAQVVVLLSRTTHASDIYFVGDKDATINHILDVLQKTHRFLPYIISLLTNLCHETVQTPVFQLPPLYRPCDAIVGSVKCVYLIVSTRDVSYSYIGETSNMGQRLKKHSTGTGAIITGYPALQPWGLMGYITGFDNRQERQRFEALWKETSRRRCGQRGTADAIMHVAHGMVETSNRDRDPSRFLRLVQCGQVTPNLITTDSPT